VDGAALSEQTTSPAAKYLPFGSIAVIIANIAGLGLSALFDFRVWESCPAQSGIPFGFGEGFGFVLVQGFICLPLLAVNTGYLAYSVIKIFQSKNWWPLAFLGCVALCWAGLIAANNAYSCVIFPV
jgi:hypothetical protein